MNYQVWIEEEGYINISLDDEVVVRENLVCLSSKTLAAQFLSWLLIEKKMPDKVLEKVVRAASCVWGVETIMPF